MKFDKFQSKVGKILNKSAIGGVLFLTEESGEVAKVFKKSIDKNEVADQEELHAELGDVLIALAVLSNATGLSLDEIAGAAIDKWTQREEERDA